MKRLLCLMVMLTMTLGIMSVAYAEEDETMLALNIQAVKANLDAAELKYDQLGDNNDVFKLNYTLDGTLNSGTLWIAVYDDGVQFEADYDISATDANRATVAEKLCQINAQLRIGGFYIEESGTIGNGAFYYTGSQTPSQESVTEYRDAVLGNLESYSEEIAEVLFSK